MSHCWLPPPFVFWFGVGGSRCWLASSESDGAFLSLSSPSFFSLIKPLQLTTGDRLPRPAGVPCGLCCPRGSSYSRAQQALYRSVHHGLSCTPTALVLALQARAGVHLGESGLPFCKGQCNIGGIHRHQQPWSSKKNERASVLPLVGLFVLRVQAGPKETYSHSPGPSHREYGQSALTLTHCPGTVGEVCCVFVLPSTFICPSLLLIKLVLHAFFGGFWCWCQHWWWC